MPRGCCRRRGVAVVRVPRDLGLTLIRQRVPDDFPGRLVDCHQAELVLGDIRPRVELALQRELQHRIWIGADGCREVDTIARENWSGVQTPCF